MLFIAQRYNQPKIWRESKLRASDLKIQSYFHRVCIVGAGDICRALLLIFSNLFKPRVVCVEVDIEGCVVYPVLLYVVTRVWAIFTCAS